MKEIEEVEIENSGCPECGNENLDMTDDETFVCQDCGWVWTENVISDDMGGSD